MPDATETRLRGLERRVNVLTAVIIIEAIVLGGLMRYVTIGLVLLLPVLAYTHHRLPPLARRIGRFLAPISRSSAAAH